MDLVPLPADGLAATFPAALAAALAGTGPVVAPLPPRPAAALAMLAPARPVTEPGAALVVGTSGSTGAPKGVVLSATALRAAAAATHAHLGGPGAWHCPIPLHYVAGAMTLVRAVLAGTAHVVLPHDLEGIAVLPGRNYVSLVPTQLVRALADPATVEALAAFDAVLLGGARPTAGLVERAQAAGIPVMVTYGMSESCGGCVYDGNPLPGTSVELVEEGRILLRTDAAFSGYRLRPDLTAATLVDGAIRTADRGRLEPDGRLTVLGRLDDVVVTGGVNVDLGAVGAAAVRAFPGAETAVIAVDDDEWGARIVLATDADTTLAAARARMTSGLERVALPRQVLVGPLPRLDSGKVDRGALAEWARATTTRR